MSVRDDILDRLTAGGPCSGEQLAAALGVSRAAIAKHIRDLREAGWPIEARRGADYRLGHGFRPLRREAIEGELAPVIARVAALDIRGEVDSTNSNLAAGAVSAGGRARLCIAERQAAGRGRRGRRWHAAVGGGITFSLARGFDRPPAGLLGLGLVAGVAAAECLAAHGVAGVRLKWPNDLYIDDAHAGAGKIGGLLIEIAGEAAGPARAIVGLGVNYDLPEDGVSIDQPVSGVRRAAPTPPDRSHLAGGLMAGLITAFDQFEHEGLAPFLARWRPLDALAGRAVRVDAPNGAVTGIARDLASDGALVLATAAGERRFLSGDVSVRATA